MLHLFTMNTISKTYRKVIKTLTVKRGDPCTLEKKGEKGTNARLRPRQVAVRRRRRVWGGVVGGVLQKKKKRV